MAWRVRGQAPPKASAETSTGDAAWTSQKPHPEEIRREREGGKQALWKLIRTAGNVPGWQKVMRFPLPRPSPFRAVVSRGPLSGWWGHLWRQRREEGDRLQLAHLWNRLLPYPGSCQVQEFEGLSTPSSGWLALLPCLAGTSLLPVLCPGLQAGHPAWCGAWGGRGSPGSGHPSAVGKADGSLFSSYQLFRQEKRERSRGRPLHTRTLTPDPCVRASLPFFDCTCKLGVGGGDGF